MGEWREYPLEEVIDFKEGPGILAKDFRAEGVPLIRLSGLEPGGSVTRGCDYLDPDMVRAKWAHFSVAEGDILLSSSATLGRTAVVGADAVGAIPYTGIIRMRPRDGRITSAFIRYLLSGADFQRQAELAGVGSVMRHFGPMHLRQMTVRLPPVDEQHRIAGILGALDDKIELDRRSSETLEAMARALFRSWFVDFDPVRAKVEGRDPGLPPHLADLFSDRLVDSEVGAIPEGWKVQAVGELAEIVGGSTPSTSDLRYWDGAHRWATPKDLASLTVPALLDTARSITDAGLAQIASGLLPTGTVLLSSRAPIGYLAITQLPVAINQGFIAMKPQSGIPAQFLLRWASAAMDEIVRRANGSTFLEISKAAFRPIPVVVPSRELLAALDRTTNPGFQQVVASERERASLVDLRDALLPRLLSGEMEATA